MSEKETTCQRCGLIRGILGPSIPFYEVSFLGFPVIVCFFCLTEVRKINSDTFDSSKKMIS